MEGEQGRRCLGKDRREGWKEKKGEDEWERMGRKAREREDEWKDGGDEEKEGEE